MKKFISPQTNSEYSVVAENSTVLIGARYLGQNHYRITVRSDWETLEPIQSDLMFPDGIQNDDHISVVIQDKDQLLQMIDRVIEVVDARTEPTTLIDNWESLLQKKDLVVECPVCSAEIYL